jgi:hypothetical protein
MAEAGLLAGCCRNSARGVRRTENQNQSDDPANIRSSRRCLLSVVPPPPQLTSPDMALADILQKTVTVGLVGLTAVGVIFFGGVANDIFLCYNVVKK